MKVSAWHSSHEFMSTIHLEASVPKITLGKTHGLLPVTCLVLGTDIHLALQKGFNFFNWVQDDFTAPQSVNDFAKEFGSHASMSVGDVVEINGRFWYCEPMGWTALPDLTEEN